MCWNCLVGQTGIGKVEHEQPCRCVGDHTGKGAQGAGQPCESLLSPPLRSAVSPGMFRPLSATATLISPAPPDKVWAALTDATRWPEVLTDLASARIDPDGALAPGATIRTVALPDRNVIDMSYRVIDAEPSQRLVLESSADGFSARTVYEFRAAESGIGTEVTVTAVVRPDRFAGKITSTLWPHKYNEHIERSIRRRTTALLELASENDA